MNATAKIVVKQTLGLFALCALALFLPAGTIAWPAGWLYLLLFIGFFLGMDIWLYQHNPGLIVERSRFGTSDQKGWDRLLFPLMVAFPIAWYAFIALDAVRFHWSVVPVLVQGFGAVLLLGSFYLFFLTFRENTYLSTVVRIQADRGHEVISTGPYHFVRHPMYAGMTLYSLATPLFLGSWYGVLVGLILVGMVARRAVLEERTLQEELRGYAEYMTRVKYRIIPHLW